jgi:hypothetical protein
MTSERVIDMTSETMIDFVGIPTQLHLSFSFNTYSASRTQRRVFFKRRENARIFFGPRWAAKGPVQQMCNHDRHERERKNSEVFCFQIRRLGVGDGD